MHVESKTGALLVLLPDDKFRISCTQAGPNNRFTQYLSMEITPAIFEREIAPARTFVFYEDVEAAHGQKFDQGRQPRKRDRGARRGGPEQGTVAFPGRIRPAQNSRYYRRPRAGRPAHSRSRRRGETRSCGERGTGSRTRSRADAKKRDGRTARNPKRRWRSRHWRSDADSAASLPVFDGRSHHRLRRRKQNVSA